MAGVPLASNQKSPEAGLVIFLGKVSSTKTEVIELDHLWLRHADDLVTAKVKLKPMWTYEGQGPTTMNKGFLQLRRRIGSREVDNGEEGHDELFSWLF